MRTDSLEKAVMLGKIKGRKRREQQWTSWLDGITDTIDMGLSKLRWLVKDRKAWRAAVHGVTKSRYDWVTQLDWTGRDLQEHPFLTMTWPQEQRLWQWEFCNNWPCLCLRFCRKGVCWKLSESLEFFRHEPPSPCRALNKRFSVPNSWYLGFVCPLCALGTRTCISVTSARIVFLLVKFLAC